MKSLKTKLKGILAISAMAVLSVGVFSVSSYADTSTELPVATYEACKIVVEQTLADLEAETGSELNPDDCWIELASVSHYVEETKVMQQVYEDMGYECVISDVILTDDQNCKNTQENANVNAHETAHNNAHDNAMN